jgi:hypothetical protein
MNLISMAAFKKLQIPMLVPVIPHGCISLSVTFGTPENFCMESILFDVAEESLPLDTISGRPALYQFMTVAHYVYLVLKIPSPNDVHKIRGDRDAGVSALEKLQALATQHEAAAGPGSLDQAPSSSRQRGSTSAPRVQPSGKEDVPEKTIQIGADAAQTTHIVGDLDSK